VVAESGEMQRVFVRAGFGFADGLRRANSLPGFGFVRFMFAGLGFLVVFVDSCCSSLFRLFFVNFDFFFEDRAAGDSSACTTSRTSSCFASIQAGRKDGALVVAELRNRCRFPLRRQRPERLPSLRFLLRRASAMSCASVGIVHCRLRRPLDRPQRGAS